MKNHSESFIRKPLLLYQINRKHGIQLNVEEAEVMWMDLQVVADGKTASGQLYVVGWNSVRGWRT